MKKGYEMVIGLEVHAELATRTKIFCSCKTDFGAEPNTQCCPVCMGMPGTLPVLNTTVVDYAVMAGLATNCSIARFSKQDRKNYFYPDLPKAYQISQYDKPLCEHGWLDVTAGGETKRIGITRIHIEEDAGKLIHDEKNGTFIDCNRCGVPLIEIVSEPDIRSADEAVAYVRRLRSLLMYTGVSDCRMNEGSLRCDVNLSVRKTGDERLGTRTEMKNLNSFRFIKQAIEYEFARQVEAVESGETVVQETRRFDAQTGKTFSMRLKENADDYRYFPDPDLPPIEITLEQVECLKAKIPVLPDERMQKYIEKYSLTAYDSEQLTAEKPLADYFEAAAPLTDYPKLLANLIIGEISALVGNEPEDIPLSPAGVAAVAQLMGEGKVNSGTAKEVLRAVFAENADPVEYVERNGLAQINTRAELEEITQRVIDENPKAAADFRSGKLNAQKAIVGKVMAATGGRANPVIVNKLTEELLLKK